MRFRDLLHKMIKRGVSEDLETQKIQIEKVESVNE